MYKVISITYQDFQFLAHKQIYFTAHAMNLKTYYKAKSY